MQAGRDLPCLQRQNHLDEPGDTRGGLQVSDVRLDRSDLQGMVGGPAHAEGGPQRLHLDRVAQRGAGAVGLDVIDVGRLHSRVGQRRQDHRFLGWAVGRRQPVAAAILIQGRTANHRQDVVAVGPCVGQPLEQDHAAAFAANVSIGALVKGLAPPVGGQHARLGEHPRHVGRQDQIHSAGQSRPAFPRAQASAGQVDGRQ